MSFNLTTGFHSLDYKCKHNTMQPWKSRTSSFGVLGIALTKFSKRISSAWLHVISFPGLRPQEKPAIRLIQTAVANCNWFMHQNSFETETCTYMRMHYNIPSCTERNQGGWTWVWSRGCCKDLQVNGQQIGSELDGFCSLYDRPLSW